MVHTYVRIRYSGHITKHTISCTTASSAPCISDPWKRAHHHCWLIDEANCVMKIPHTHSRESHANRARNQATLDCYAANTQRFPCFVNNHGMICEIITKWIILRGIISIYTKKRELRKHQVSGRVWRQSCNNFCRLILQYSSYLIYVVLNNYIFIFEAHKRKF